MCRKSGQSSRGKSVVGHDPVTWGEDRSTRFVFSLTENYIREMG